MTRTSRRRPQGGIEELPSGSLRVYAYSNIDPLSGKKHYLRELIPAGTPNAEKEAEKALRRLLSQIDERRHPTTNATLDQLLDRYLETLDVAETTRMMYAKYCTKHVRPFVGRLEASSVDVEALDSVDAELRRCRIHCDRSRGLVDHRTPRPHQCDSRCRPHRCNSLSSTTIRHIHFVLRGAFEKGVRWRCTWICPTPFSRSAARSRSTGRSGSRKDTKTHQQRRVALDPETVTALTEHLERCTARCEALGVPLTRDAFVLQNSSQPASMCGPSRVGSGMVGEGGDHAPGLRGVGGGG
ncbi:hypothetical protein [Pseudonocardia adelaidensis]